MRTTIRWAEYSVQLEPDYVLEDGPFDGMTLVDFWNSNGVEFFRWTENRLHSFSNDFVGRANDHRELRDMVVLDDESYYVTLNE